MDGQEPKTPEELAIAARVWAMFEEDLRARLKPFTDRRMSPELLDDLREEMARLLGEWLNDPEASKQYQVTAATRADGTTLLEVSWRDPRPQPIVAEFTLSKAEDEKP